MNRTFSPCLELTESEEIYKSIFDNSAEGSILIDETGSITEWNKFMESKTGISKDRAIGKKIWHVQASLLTPDLKKIYSADSLKGIWTGLISKIGEDQILSKEGQYPDKDGNLILTEDIISLLKIGTRKYLYVIQRDLTERRNLEQQLRIQEQKLTSINQTKDKIISIISHDLRNPITAVLGFTQLMHDSIESFDAEKLKDYLEHIQYSSQNTLRLLDNLLVWSKTQTGRFSVNLSRVNLNSVIRQMIDELYSAANLKNIILTYSPDENIELNADINLLRIILRNLLHNAIKFTRGGGKVIISAVISGDKVKIMIADNGVGMNDEMVSKLFQPGHTMSNAGTANESGSGLGLVLCRELIEMQGGRIWVESKVNEGSRFMFELLLQ